MLSTSHLRRNEITSNGDNVIVFENDLKIYLKGKSYLACLSSGSVAIHFALLQFGVSLNDEVLPSLCLFGFRKSINTL